MATRRRRSQSNPLDSLNPNEETLKAIEELEEGSGESYETITDVFEELHKAEEESGTTDFFQPEVSPPILSIATLQPSFPGPKKQPRNVPRSSRLK